MAEKFDVVDVIKVKRDGGMLPDGQIDWVVDAYTRGVVADEQMAALAMAIFINGMERPEIARWTDAMIRSGETMDFSSLGKPTADKHSTGGTLDKLEAIPGWRADLTNDELMNILRDPGCVICAAGSGLAPADKKLYALRDITSTVDCIPLIASSIMSKKIAEGTDSLVLDVKVGSGAFMKDEAMARDLARTMVDLGNDAGVDTVALLTDMSVPLGRCIGNALEVRESVEVLAGGGPDDVVELTLALAREMLSAAGQPDADVEKALADGRAMDTWNAMIRAQGGDPEAALPTARHTHDVVAEADGVVTKMEALALGVGSWRLGAGRARKEDPVQAGAGIELHVDLGETVAKGQKLFTLHTDDEERFERALESALPGIAVEADGIAPERKVIIDRIS